MRPVFFILLVTTVQCLNPLRKYSMRRDFFKALKAPEFSIFDATGEKLLYRIESYYNARQSIELMDVSSKQVIARLKNRFTVFLYEGTLEIFDPPSQQWIKGNVSQSFKLFDHKSSLEWNGTRVIMEKNFTSSVIHFSNEQHDQLFAKSIASLGSLFSGRQYTLKIYSNALPDTIYILGTAVRDFISSKRKYKLG